jgi:Tol biopolymer transport system component
MRASIFFLGIAATALAQESVRDRYVLHPSGWYEGAFSESTVSRDGKWLFFTATGKARVLDVDRGRDATEEFLSGFDSVRSAAPFGAGGLALLGARGAERGWFVPDASGYFLSALPPDALPRWNDRGDVAFFRRDETRRRLHVRDAEYELRGEGCALAWLPDGRGLLVLTWHSEGSAELRSYALDGSFRTIARELDAPFFFTSMAVSPDGSKLFLALASKDSPRAESRHDPAADRDLDLYSLDLSSGARTLFFGSAGDDFSPAIAGSSLFWISNEGVQQVAAFPIEGGPLRVVVEHGYLPAFSPDGTKLAYTVGDWRLADVPMNLDAMVLAIDRDARVVSKPEGIVVGFHEDFTPAWSRDGKWLAYHSHRSPRAVSIFNEEGSTDDVYLRRADGSSPEIRLTDFGHEVGSAVWLPDSRRLVFGSREPGPSGIESRTWMVEIDSDSGTAVSRKELPLPAGIRSLDGLAFSPNGAEIAMLGDGEGGTAIWIQDAGTGSLTRVAPYASTTHGGLDWSPDGKTLVYSALGSDHMEIFAITRDRPGGSSWSEPHRLASDGADLLHPKVSPDGRFVAVSRVKWTKRIRSRGTGR